MLEKVEIKKTPQLCKQMKCKTVHKLIKNWLSEHS